MEKRIFGLDVLRAVAIALVLAAHLFEGAAFFLSFDSVPFKPLLNAFGYLGVEIFFVLSGFLIGRIVLDIVDRGSSGKQWRIFLVRRWGRTVPLYLLWVVVLLVLDPPEQDVASAAVHYMTFTQNLAWPMPAGNWFPVSWSLPVEEWFYVLFALCVFVVSAISRRRAVLVACCLFIVLPLAGRFLVEGDWDAVLRKVVLLRLDTIAYGVAVAMLWNTQRDRLVRVSLPLALVGAACLIVVCWNVADLVKDPIGGRLVFNMSAIGTAFCLPAMANWRAARSWRTAPVTWLAERSYGLYLGHLSMMFATVKVFQWGWISLGAQSVLFMFASLCLVTELLYRAVELPVLTRRPAQPKPDVRSFERPTQGFSEPIRPEA